jgi:hypothetical protein
MAFQNQNRGIQKGTIKPRATHSTGSGEFEPTPFLNFNSDAEREIELALRQANVSEKLLARVRAGLYDSNKPWDRQSGEPLAWFLRFEQFRILGPDALPIDVANLERIEAGRKRSKILTPSWKEAVKKWKWVERRDAYYIWLTQLQRQKEFDAVMRDNENEELSKLKQRDIRRKLLENLEAKVAEAITYFDPKTAKSLQRFVLDGIAIIQQEGRKEWDDEPETRRALANGDTGDLANQASSVVNITNNNTINMDLDQKLEVITGRKASVNDHYSAKNFFEELFRAAQESGIIESSNPNGLSEEFDSAFPLPLTDGSGSQNDDSVEPIQGEII